MAAPPAELLRMVTVFLPRNQTLGGYIFLCNNRSMQDSLRQQIFGMPDVFRDSVRAIRPGIALFLYNYQTGYLHGIFEATSFGNVNIYPSAWPNNNVPGTSRLPAQVCIRWRRECPPLPYSMFPPLFQLLPHYQGLRIRIEMSFQQALGIMDAFDLSRRSFLSWGWILTLAHS